MVDSNSMVDSKYSAALACPAVLNLVLMVKHTRQGQRLLIEVAWYFIAVISLPGGYLDTIWTVTRTMATIIGVETIRMMDMEMEMVAVLFM